jgi:acetyl-CoA carboxylase biotin carboxyl carrier protein
MSLTHEDVRKILALLDESEYEEVHIELPDLKLDVRRHAEPGQARPMGRLQKSAAETVRGKAAESRQPTGNRALAQAPQEPVPEGVTAIRAPMVGTFYRAASPGAKPFVEPGDKVQPEDTVCLLEVMKLFNSLKAGVEGTVDKVLVENAALVAYGQPLILIRKTGA